MTSAEIEVIRDQMDAIRHKAKARLQRIRDLEERVRILERNFDQTQVGEQ